MPRLKVLHVVSISFSLPYFIGEQFTFFKQRGVDFQVVASPSAHFLSYSEKMDFDPFPIVIKRSVSPLQDLKSIFAIRRLILNEKVDIVIGHTPKGGMIAMVAAFLAGNKKRVYVRHGIMFETSSGIKRLLLISIERLTGFLAKKVVCVSPSILKVSNDKRLSKRKHNFVLGKGTCNGIDGIRFAPENVSHEVKEQLRCQYNIAVDDQVVGYVGRIVNDKGIRELYDAWQIVKLQRPGVKLLLVGPFEERDGLSLKLKEDILADCTIICVGLVNDVLDYYSLMNVFVLPSYREGFPTVVLEASAMELPVVTTRATGCIDSIINRETGRFTSLAPEDLASNILFYLVNREVAQNDGRKGREFVVDNFSQHIVWEEIENKVINNWHSNRVE